MLVDITKKGKFEFCLACPKKMISFSYKPSLNWLFYKFQLITNFNSHNFIQYFIIKLVFLSLPSLSILKNLIDFFYINNFIRSKYGLIIIESIERIKSNFFFNKC